MTEIKTVNGRWTFKEDFGFGTDEGYAELEQESENLKGIVVYTERIEGEQPFGVRQKVEGSFDGLHFNLTGTSVELFNCEKQFEYHLDTWEGTLNARGQIVGHSYDNHNCFGVFVMSKTEHL